MAELDQIELSLREVRDKLFGLESKVNTHFYFLAGIGSVAFALTAWILTNVIERLLLR